MVYMLQVSTIKKLSLHRRQISNSLAFSYLTINLLGHFPAQISFNLRHNICSFIVLVIWRQRSYIPEQILWHENSGWLSPLVLLLILSFNPRTVLVFWHSVNVTTIRQINMNSTANIFAAIFLCQCQLLRGIC